MFFIATVFLGIWVVFKIGAQRGLGQPMLEMTVYFRSIGGLAAGAPVTLSGVNVGTVQDVDFIDPPIQGRSVRVVLSLYKRYEGQLHKATDFIIKIGRAHV